MRHGDNRENLFTATTKSRGTVYVRAATGVTQQVIKCRYYNLLFVESIVFLHLSAIWDYIPCALFLDDRLSEERAMSLLG